MKKIITLLALIAAVGMTAGPLALHAAETEEQFRHRISASDEVGSSDIAEEVRFGREVASRVVARFGLYENPVMMKYVNLVGRVLVQSTNRPEIEFRFAVLNTDDINAYAAPGGYVFVTRGALARMRDESELAGVLAHEIAHIVEKHVVKELNIKGSDQSTAAGFATLIGGTSQSARTAFAQAVDKALDMLFKDGYKRVDETQADKDAVMFSAMAGYDPSGLVKYFERISTSKEKKNTEVLDKTHPAYDVRIAWMKSTITQEGMDSGTYKIQKERFADALKQMK